MPSRLSIKVVLAAIDVEVACADLYAHYADAYDDDPELSALWRQMSLEEKGHANQLHMLRRLLNETNSTTDIDEFQARTLLSMIHGILGGIKRHLPKPQEAISSALKLERKLEVLHAQFLAIFPDNALAEVFAAMGRYDLDHVNRLERALNRWEP